MSNLTLDLHGIKHSDAKAHIERFIHQNELPVSIITGNSSKMKSILFDILKKEGLYGYYLDVANLGKIFITEEEI